jgi:hypothetical protein
VLEPEVLELPLAVTVELALHHLLLGHRLLGLAAVVVA